MAVKQLLTSHYSRALSCALTELYLDTGTRYILKPGQLSRYSDSLHAEGSGDRMLVNARFSFPVQTSTGVHPGPCTIGTGPLVRG